MHVASGLRFQKTWCLPSFLCRWCKDLPSSEVELWGLSQSWPPVHLTMNLKLCKSFNGLVHLYLPEFCHLHTPLRSEDGLLVDVPEAQPLLLRCGSRASSLKASKTNQSLHTPNKGAFKNLINSLQNFYYYINLDLQKQEHKASSALISVI